MKRIAYRLVFAPAVALFVFVSVSAFAGSLTPPGAPGPTMKPLSEIEPRIAITQVPMEINEPGSYYFTANLVHNTTNSIAINVRTTGTVTIDLNGFALIGPGKETPDEFCPPGISGGSNTHIKNGTVRGFCYGVSVGDGGSVCNVHAVENKYQGIWVGGFDCRVVDNVASNNGGNAGIADGAIGIIVSGSRNLISGNICNNNCGDKAGRGISLIGFNSSCVVTNNICNYNRGAESGVGIDANERDIIRGNTCIGNEGWGPANAYGRGIICFEDCVVSDNVCKSNKGTNYSIGIEAARRCQVQGNHCSDHNLATAENMGIKITYTDCFVISNFAVNNGHDIYFTAASVNGFAGGNLTANGIHDFGTNTKVRATSPLSNDQF
jgi:hypothetical protein